MSFPASISRPKSTLIGAALHQSLFYLFGDLDRQVLSDSSVTVSEYETTGSPYKISIPLLYNSLRSLRQISTWRSPHPAIICSLVYSS